MERSERVTKVSDRFRDTIPPFHLSIEISHMHFDRKRRVDSRIKVIKRKKSKNEKLQAIFFFQRSWIPERKKFCTSL